MPWRLRIGLNQRARKTECLIGLVGEKALNRVLRSLDLKPPGLRAITCDLCSLCSIVEGQRQKIHRLSDLLVPLCLFSAAPAVHGGSQARGGMGIAVASLHLSHGNTRSPSCLCDLHHNSRQCRLLNPLSETRDRT